MLNITHAESAILGGSARFKAWLDKFTKQWNEPVMNAVVLRWWDTMSPATKQQAKDQYPTEFAQIEEKIEAVRDRED
jgi:hypothetical protein